MCIRDRTWSAQSWSGNNTNTSTGVQLTHYSISASNPAAPLYMQILMWVNNGRGAQVIGDGFDSPVNNLIRRHQFKYSAYSSSTTNYIRFYPYAYGTNSNQAWTGHLKVERYVT